MAVYDLDGHVLQNVLNLDGDAVSTAFDLDGNAVYNSSGVRLKLMSYNVGQWYTGSNRPVPTEQKQAYYDLQSGIMLRHRPDILCIQEFLNAWCADGSLAVNDFLNPYFDTIELTNPNSGYIGHAICSNGIQIRNYTSHNFTTNKGNYPTFESCEILVGGKVITLINTHNDYTVSYQTQEVTDLLNFIDSLDGGSFILCGDFNNEDSEKITTSAHYNNCVRRFLEAGYRVGNGAFDWVKTYYGVVAASINGDYSDSVVCSQDIIIERIYADTTKLTDDISDKTDHLPFIAELIVN